jgi:HEAT repeat protein
VLFRTPLRSRYWAWRLEQAATPSQRSVYLAALCNAGDRGRWGVSALLASADPELRSYGVLVLHHVRTDWARKRLLECLSDADPSVQRLAAAGLAIHGDDAVVPTLKQLYQAEDAESGRTACLALERLGTPAAIAALGELAVEPADAGRHAALVDALAGIGRMECGPALLGLLDDHRVCDLPPSREELPPRLTRELAAQGYRLGAGSQPASEPAGRTIAERAAAALAQITGLKPAFSSAAPEPQRAAARKRWADWLSDRDVGR